MNLREKSILFRYLYSSYTEEEISWKKVSFKIRDFENVSGTPINAFHAACAVRSFSPTHFRWSGHFERAVAMAKSNGLLKTICSIKTKESNWGTFHDWLTTIVLCDENWTHENMGEKKEEKCVDERCRIPTISCEYQRADVVDKESANARWLSA